MTRNPGGKWKERLPASVSLVPASTRDFLFLCSFLPSFSLSSSFLLPFVIIFFCTILRATSFSFRLSFPFHPARLPVATHFILTLESPLDHLTLCT